MAGRWLTALLALTLVGGAAAAQRPVVRVSKPPATARPGTTWEAAIDVRGARAAAFVVSAAGRERTVRLRPSGSRYRAHVVFTTSGPTRFGVRVHGRTVWAGRLTVLPPLVQQPFGVLAEPSGTVLVADWQGSAVYRLHPGGRQGSLVGRVEAVRDLKPARNGKLLATSGPTVVELDPATGAMRTLGSAGAAAEGLAEAPDGTLYVSTQSSIVAIAPDRSRRAVATGLNGVRGLLLTDAGLVACESLTGRLLLVTPTGTHVLASGLAGPSYAVAADGGALYVSELAGSRVSRVDPSGAVTPVASVPKPGPMALDGAGRLIVGSLTGAIYRVTPATGAVAPIWR